MKKLLLAVGLLSITSFVLAKSDNSKVMDVSGSDFKKKYGKGNVVLKIYGETCPPCRASLPHFATLSNEMNDVRFFAIEMGNDDAGVAQGVSGVPTFIFFKNGNEVDRTSGFNDIEGLRQFIVDAKAKAGESKPAPKEAAKPVAKKSVAKKEVTKKRPAEEVVVEEESWFSFGSQKPAAPEEPKKKKQKSGAYGKSMKKGEVTSECTGGNCDSACARGKCGR